MGDAEDDLGTLGHRYQRSPDKNGKLGRSKLEIVEDNSGDSIDYIQEQKDFNPSPDRMRREKNQEMEIELGQQQK